jgi:hypothetical protein
MLAKHEKQLTTFHFANWGTPVVGSDADESARDQHDRWQGWYHCSRHGDAATSQSPGPETNRL